jgi:hypothetical protein
MCWRVHADNQNWHSRHPLAWCQRRARINGKATRVRQHGSWRVLDYSPYKDAKVDGRQIWLHQGQCLTSNPTLLVYAGYCHPRRDHYWLMFCLSGIARDLSQLRYCGAFQPESDSGECLKFPQDRLVQISSTSPGPQMRISVLCLWYAGCHGPLAGVCCTSFVCNELTYASRFQMHPLCIRNSRFIPLHFTAPITLEAPQLRTIFVACGCVTVATVGSTHWLRITVETGGFMFNDLFLEQPAPAQQDAS